MDGYIFVDVLIMYDIFLGDIDLLVYLSGENLIDEEVCVYILFLKDIVLCLGRNFVFGVCGYF